MHIKLDGHRTNLIKIKFLGKPKFYHHILIYNYIYINVSKFLN